MHSIFDFATGQRVRVNAEDPDFTGTAGTITHVATSKLIIRVHLDGHNADIPFPPSELDIISTTTTQEGTVDE